VPRRPTSSILRDVARHGRVSWHRSGRRLVAVHEASALKKWRTAAATVHSGAGIENSKWPLGQAVAAISFEQPVNVSPLRVPRAFEALISYLDIPGISAPPWRWPSSFADRGRDLIVRRPLSPSSERNQIGRHCNSRETEAAICHDHALFGKNPVECDGVPPPAGDF